MRVSMSQFYTAKRLVSFAASIAILGTPFFSMSAAFAQNVPDVMNALGVPYSPTVEHELMESDRRQLYGKQSDPPAVPLWDYLRGNQSLKPEVDSNANKPAVSAPVEQVGEIDESSLEDFCQAYFNHEETAANAKPVEAAAPKQKIPQKNAKPKQSSAKKIASIAKPMPVKPVRTEKEPAKPYSFLDDPAAKAQFTSVTDFESLPAQSQPAETNMNPEVQAKQETAEVEIPAKAVVKPNIEEPAQDANVAQSEIAKKEALCRRIRSEKHALENDNKMSAALEHSMDGAIRYDAPSKVVHIGGYLPAETMKPITFIDKTGKTVIPSSPYKQISQFSSGMICVLVEPVPETTALASAETGAGEQNSASDATPVLPKYGYMNTAGQWVIEPKFQMAGDFKPADSERQQDIVARAQWPDQGSDFKWGYVNIAGEPVIENKFDWGGDFSEGYAIVSLPVEDITGKVAGHQYGYIDIHGDLTVRPQFDEAEPFHNGLAKVWRGKLNEHGWPQYRFITPDGETAFESIYDWVSSFQNGYARVGFLDDARSEETKSTTPKQFGYINTKGELLVPLQFESAWPFVEVSSANPAAKTPAKTGAAAKSQTANVQNKQLIALVKQNGKYGYIGPAGNFLFPERFDWADEFHERLAAVKIGNKFGFINTQGKIVVKPEYDWVGAFSEGYAAVAKQTPEGLRHGFINTQGKLVIPTQYAWVTPFRNGLAQVR